MLLSRLVTKLKELPERGLSAVISLLPIATAQAKPSVIAIPGLTVNRAIRVDSSNLKILTGCPEEYLRRGAYPATVKVHVKRLALVYAIRILLAYFSR